jgi:hypothetical protein
MQIMPVLCRNVVKEIQMLIYPWTYNYTGLPHSIITKLVRKVPRNSPEDLDNVKGCCKHRWKASPNVRETPGC